jgi:hypothetical protein
VCSAAPWQPLSPVPALALLAADYLHGLTEPVDRSGERLLSVCVVSVLCVMGVGANWEDSICANGRKLH